MSRLFEPYDLAGYTLHNRSFMAPLPLPALETA